MPGEPAHLFLSRLSRTALIGLGALSLLTACGRGVSPLGPDRSGTNASRAAPVVAAGLFTSADIGKHQLMIAILLRSREPGPVVVEPPTWRGSSQLQVVAAGVMPGRLAPDAATAPRLVRLSRRETTGARGSSAAVLVFHLDCVAQRYPVTGYIYLHVRVRGERLSLRAPVAAAAGELPWTQALPPEICP
jgi:hypothetical protein